LPARAPSLQSDGATVRDVPGGCTGRGCSWHTLLMSSAAPAIGYLSRPLRASSFVWLALCYLALFALGIGLQPSLTAPAALWPAHAVDFVVYVLLPIRFWPYVALATGAMELAAAPALHVISTGGGFVTSVRLGLVLANALTGAGPAALVRWFKLIDSDHRPFRLISPLWPVALFLGTLPGSIVGTWSQNGFSHAPTLADVGLWMAGAVLGVMTYAPVIWGALTGYDDRSVAPARRAELIAVAGLVIALFAMLALAPWPLADRQAQLMLLSVPLIWLALRFSRYVTAVGVLVIATGIAFASAHGAGAFPSLATATGWRDLIFATEIFLLISCGGALLINRMVLRQRRLLDELAVEHDQLRHYAEALAGAEEAARRSTAVDLHDGVGQVLAGLGLILRAMRTHVGDEPLAGLVEQATSASREAQDAIRAMIQDLTPPELERASLAEVLTWLTQLFATRYQFNVVWDIVGPTDVPIDRVNLIYRITRELLFNAYKHSQRKRADVEVTVQEQAIEIRVIDEGVGFDVNASSRSSSKRFGLTQLRERVRAAGGTVELDSVMGEGCRVKVRLPVPVQAAAMRHGA
jgi:signal transduction histidine kinase